MNPTCAHLSEAMRAALQAFVDENQPRYIPRSRWLSAQGDAFRMYVRMGPRVLPAPGGGAPIAHPTLTLATIEVAAAHRGRGAYAATLQHAMALCDAQGLALMIESALSEIVAASAQRRGFIPGVQPFDWVWWPPGASPCEGPSG
jgi:GNAT superfamily N-acetyltransferase